MLDPAPITRFLRAKAGSQLLVAAVHHFNIFEILNDQQLSLHELQLRLKLKERPAMVLFPALCAMRLLQFTPEQKLEIAQLGHFLTSAHPENLIGYLALEKEDPGVLHMTSWLKNDGPVDLSQGISYIKDDQADSPMDDPETGRFFTQALAGRARFLSPVVARKMSKKDGHMLDVAGGTGYYTYEWLNVNPTSTATIFDRPEVLKVAEEILEHFCKSKNLRNLKQRITFHTGDMIKDELPECDILLAASLFHDWPAETCELLANKFAITLRPGGELWIHDSFLNDTLDGPVPVTDYSAMLFLGTKGRAYSRNEYRKWLSAAGLVPVNKNIATLMDYGLISAIKP